jgi:hypothetical protein
MIQTKKAGGYPAFKRALKLYFFIGAVGAAAVAAVAVLAPPSKKALTQVVWVKIA